LEEGVIAVRIRIPYPATPAMNDDFALLANRSSARCLRSFGLGPMNRTDPRRTFAPRRPTSVVGNDVNPLRHSSISSQAAVDLDGAITQ
jgi:hypothetical protein